jgi:hypothetical protein
MTQPEDIVTPIIPEVEPLPPPSDPTIDLLIASDTRIVHGYGQMPAGTNEPGLEVVAVPATLEPELQQPGTKILNADNVSLTIIPPEPPPIVYAGTRTVDTRVRTTDDVPVEVFRFTTSPKHVYRATFRMAAIDAANGVTKDSEVRMTFKATASALNQVGATAALYTVQDAGAGTWGIQASAQFPDLVISVRGAVGRTIDWLLVAEIGSYAPEGLA